MIKIKCPRCKESFNAPDAYAGKSSHCPVCKHPVLVPSPDEPVSIILPSILAAEKPKPTRIDRLARIHKPSSTEGALRFLGTLCIISSVLSLGASIALMMADMLDTGLKILATAFPTYIIGVLYFAIFHILRYLRRIATAVEKGN